MLNAFSWSGSLQIFYNIWINIRENELPNKSRLQLNAVIVFSLCNGFGWKCRDTTQERKGTFIMQQ